MKFFKSCDFEQIRLEFINEKTSGSVFDFYALRANEKLEKEGVTVYNYKKSENGWFEHKSQYNTEKALLINIEPVEKCRHPSKSTTTFVDSFGVLWNQCKCGIFFTSKNTSSLGMKLREFEIEYGYEGQMLWPPGQPINKVSEAILFREVSPDLDAAIAECEKALKAAHYVIKAYSTCTEWLKLKGLIPKSFNSANDWMKENGSALAALKKARGE